jgi:O-antigen ligase/polysaccharide polymerase Wzy-like membrane protein
MLVTLVITTAAVHKFGNKGLFFPVALAIGIALLLRPLVAMCLTVLLTILVEGNTFGLFTTTSHLYDGLFKGLNILDFMVGLTVVAVVLDLLRTRRPLRVPRELLLPLSFLVLGMLVGVVMGRQHGVGLASAVISESTLWYLIVLPIAVYNLDIPRPVMINLLRVTFVLAAIKAVLGLVEIASGKGTNVEGAAHLTYYEPAPNWVILVALLTAFAALVGRMKLPRWMFFALPVLTLCMILSYRRSFWIGLALGLLLVGLLGLRPLGRRLLLPIALMVGLSIWLLGSIHFQAQSPITRRITSLKPTNLQTNLDDRYRLDERANVLGEIKEHPLSGLGMKVPWTATVRPLPLEHQNGRQYVHFAALWFWLKLGILGLLAYAGILASGMQLSFLVWRRSSEPLLRSFGLASMCAIIALIVLDTTASFTGVDQRFTLLFGVQLGLLALLAHSRPPEELALEND